MADSKLELKVLTPRARVLSMAAESVRIRTETGNVGLRPAMEPMILSVEPGLVLARNGPDFTWIGTAGGLMDVDGHQATLLTPLAVTAHTVADVLSELDAALSAPAADLTARATLERLQGIVLRNLARQVRNEAEGSK